MDVLTEQYYKTGHHLPVSWESAQSTAGYTPIAVFAPQHLSRNTTVVTRTRRAQPFCVEDGVWLVNELPMRCLKYEIFLGLACVDKRGHSDTDPNYPTMPTTRNAETTET